MRSARLWVLTVR